MELGTHAGVGPVQAPYNVTIVSPPSVKYTSAVNAKLAATSDQTAVLTVSAPDLALPQGATTAGNLTYIVTASAQVCWTTRICCGATAVISTFS